MTVEKPKPKQLLRPITTGAGSAMNQSQFLAITCNSLIAREKSRVHGAVGFGFDSHWLKNWHVSFKPIIKRSNRNHVSPSTVIWKLLYRSKAICNFTKMTRIKTKHITRTIYIIHIRCIFSFLFIGRELTTWPANNCLQVSVLLQIIFCSCIIETTLSCENGGSVPRAGREGFDIFCWSKERWSNDKQLLNSVIAKHHDLSVSRRSIICLSLRLREIIDLLAIDKSRYFAQPRSITVNYSSREPHLLPFFIASD